MTEPVPPPGTVQRNAVAAPPAVPPASVPDAAKPGADTEVAQSPSESCKKQVSVLKWVCMDVQCGKARYQNHPECLKLRADQERARAAGNR